MIEPGDKTHFWVRTPTEGKSPCRFMSLNR
jgi:hypothetical protein